MGTQPLSSEVPDGPALMSMDTLGDQIEEALLGVDSCQLKMAHV